MANLYKCQIKWIEESLQKKYKILDMFSISILWKKACCLFRSVNVNEAPFDGIWICCKLLISAVISGDAKCKSSSIITLLVRKPDHWLLDSLQTHRRHNRLNFGVHYPSTQPTLPCTNLENLLWDFLSLSCTIDCKWQHKNFLCSNTVQLNNNFSS